MRTRIQIVALHRTIRLFDSKYIGSFDTHTECVAFVKGVEAVLNHMLKAKAAKSVSLEPTRCLLTKPAE